MDSVYLTYDEYLTFGGTIDETAFDNLEFEARKIVDWWTYDRLQNEETYPEAVQRCMYKLITLLNDRNKAQILGKVDVEDSAMKKAGIMQESNDGVSTMYNVVSADSAISRVDDEIKSTIRMYLQNVRNSLGRKVLYRGLYPGE